MQMTKPVRRAVIIGAAALPIAAVGMSVALPATASSRHALAGTRPAWATSQNLVASAQAAVAGNTASSALSGRVWLQFNHADQVQALLAKATSTNTQARGRYLTAAQFNARFNPTAAQISTVTSWLKASGLASAVSGDRRYVEFSGSAVEVAKAFGTTFASYRHAGKVYRAPTSDASVPDAVASDVLTVTGLDNYQRVVKTSAQPPEPPPAGFRNAPLCSAYYRQQIANYQLDGTPLPTFRGAHPSWVQCGFTPLQLRGAYGVTGGAQNGAGITVATTLWYHSGTIVSDVNQYVANHDPSSPKLVAGKNFFQTNAKKNASLRLCGPAGDEESLDVEAMHAIAPAANIHYYGSQSCFDDDLITTLQKAVNDGVDVISNSWGAPTSDTTQAALAAYKQVFTQAAVQGISVMFSSGDDGDFSDATSDGSKDAGYPDSDPLVTAVGGTSVGINQSNHIAFESGWGTVKYSLSSPVSGTPTWTKSGFLYGSGGGVSIFPKQSWQSGFGSNASKRLVPDISTVGDVSTGMLIGLTQDFGRIGGGVAYGEYRIGGTSVSSPLFAGMIALADQAAHAAGKQNVGFANPGIYQLSKAGSAAIRDVIHHDGAYVRNDYVNAVNNNDGYSYSVRTVDEDTSLKTTPGYDMVTGVGTPTGSFYSSLAALAPSS
jgi:subtilase family serine protease